MRKCAIYPYSDSLFPLLENKDQLIDELCIDAVIYPKAWKNQLLHKDVLEGIPHGSDFEALTEQVECVVFADLENREFMYSDIMKKAEHALSVGKDLIFCTPIELSDLTKLKASFPDREILIKYNESKELCDNIYIHEDICCGAIGVGGVYRGLDTLAATTGITFAFQKKGIHTIGISTNATLSLLGFYLFPSYIFKSSLDPEQQVGALNAFFKGLEKKTGCDLMIIAFPDGMIKFLPETIDAYGIKAFMLTRAVAFDSFVLGSFLDNTNKESYDYIRSLLETRFGLSLHACLFQALTADREYSVESQQILYTRNNVEIMRESYETLKQTMQDCIIADYDDPAAYDLIAENFLCMFT